MPKPEERRTPIEATLVIIETIRPPGFASQLFNYRPVHVVENVQNLAGEENQDKKPIHHRETKRPVRHKTGGFRFKLGS